MTTQKIPALTARGGIYKPHSKAILEYRVWCHPRNGDDYYYKFDTYEDALEFAMQPSDDYITEEPLGVVLNKEWKPGQPRYRKYKEVRLKHEKMRA